MSGFLRRAVKMAVIPAAEIPTLSLLYKVNKLTAAPPGARPPATMNGPSTVPPPSKALNDRVGLIRGDITTLAVDAIVNAANNSLLGGGGVDGAIHRAAGPGLLAECRTLDGCNTGSAKITDAYELPCKKVIHAVGPVYESYDPIVSEMHLAGCYDTSLRLAAANNCKTVAFSAISTGVYGYPSEEAAAVALGTVRKFLQKDTEGKIEKVVLVTFEQKDVRAYNKLIPLFFPPVPEDATAAPDNTNEEADAKIDAEAEAIANELPTAPTTDPADGQGHAEKKQKHN